MQFVRQLDLRFLRPVLRTDDRRAEPQQAFDVPASPRPFWPCIAKFMAMLRSTSRPSWSTSGRRPSALVRRPAHGASNVGRRRTRPHRARRERCFSPKPAASSFATSTTATGCWPATELLGPAIIEEKDYTPCCIPAIRPRSTPAATCLSRRRRALMQQRQSSSTGLADGPDQVRGHAQRLRSGGRRNGRGLIAKRPIRPIIKTRADFPAAFRRRAENHRPVVFAARAPGVDEPHDPAGDPALRRGRSWSRGTW